MNCLFWVQTFEHSEMFINACSVLRLLFLVQCHVTRHVRHSISGRNTWLFRMQRRLRYGVTKPVNGRSVLVNEAANCWKTDRPVRDLIALSRLLQWRITQYEGTKKNFFFPLFIPQLIKVPFFIPPDILQYL